MNFPRVVFGYHGCLEPLAAELLTGRKSVADWPVSRNKGTGSARASTSGSMDRGGGGVPVSYSEMRQIDVVMR
jgi:hypothetical protein